MPRTGRIRCARQVLAGFVLVVGILTQSAASRAEDGNPQADPWYATRVRVGINGEFACHDTTLLEPGDSLLIFEGGRPARHARVQFCVPADSARRLFEERKLEAIYHDKALWDRIGPYWTFRGDPELKSLARVDSSPEEGTSLTLGITGLPAGTLWIGAAGEALSASSLDTLTPAIADSLPAWPEGSHILRSGFRFQPEGGHEMMEIFVGRAYENSSGGGSPLDSVEIQRLYLCNGRIASVRRYTRSSTEPEGADMDPPDLNDTSWSDDLDQTIGFISRDGGHIWERVFIRITFEGIWWGIQRLAGDMPLLWDFYLYTPH